MRLMLSIIIGCRYISSKRSSRYISFVSLVSFVAMSLGVMVLIVVLSVMNGFDHEIKKRILNILPHASIVSDVGITDWKLIGDNLLKINGIESYTPLVEGYGLLSSSSLSQGVLLQGISPLYEDNVSSISKHLIKGDIGDLKSGDLGCVRVYKFKMVNQLNLLAYSYEGEVLTLSLLALGSHENFYRDLKQSL